MKYCYNCGLYFADEHKICQVCSHELKPPPKTNERFIRIYQPTENEGGEPKYETDETSYEKSDTIKVQNTIDDCVGEYLIEGTEEVCLGNREWVNEKRGERRGFFTRRSRRRKRRRKKQS